jgi:hypothetical protein
MRETLGVIATLLVMVAVFWLVRRFSPPVTCPQCGGTDIVFLGDSTRECNRCGRMFFL